MSVAALCDFYVDCGCPKKRNISSPRTKQTLAEEKARVKTLKEWWGKVPFEKIELGDCSQYAAWRRSKISSSKGGGRQIDKELVTLSQIFWWATQNSKKTGITTNPLRNDRPKFCDPAQVEHCRDFQPASADELHAMARILFEVKRSEVLGWHLLMEAMVGPRASHLLQLRWDAQNKQQAGFISGSGDNRVLYLYNSKTSKGTNEFIKVHAALGKCLDALKLWRDQRYPESPWFFPSPEDPTKPIGPSSLTHALTRVSDALGIGKRTSHGLRSWFVNVHRSRGMSDAKVALLIGHKTGGKLIVEVYGTVSPEELSWMPSEDGPFKGEPAWAKFERGRYVQTELALS